MSSTTAGILFLASLIIAPGGRARTAGRLHVPRLPSAKDSRGERVVYRLIGADPKSEQTWGAYARSVLAFSAVSVLFLFLFQLVQGRLPLHLNDPGTPMTPALAWNTAVSFVTNTNWQAYSGESTQGHLVQMAGLAVQNFVSAAVGMAVAMAFVRGLARATPVSSATSGSTWSAASSESCCRSPSIVAIVLIAGGVIQNFALHDQIVNTLAGAQQTIPGGPVASQEAIKELGTNGGGFFNANSAHPFENPTAWTNWVEIFLLACIAFSLPRTFGRMVDSRKQGYAIAAVMVDHRMTSITLMMSFQIQHHGTVPTAIGSSMEGVEQRFGVPNSAVFADLTTLTSTGAVDSFHDSYTSLGGMITLFNMQLGEVAPGGVGSGLYGMLILAIITVFVAGLMVGRTPEYLGKKITPREIKLAATYFLITPLIVLTGTAVAMAMPGQRARHAQHRSARPLRGALRVHLRGQQQRLGFRGHRREHRLVQHRTRAGDAVRPVPADHLRPGTGRFAGQTGQDARLRRHAAHPPTAVRRHGRRRHADPGRPHLPAHARAGPLAEGIH